MLAEIFGVDGVIVLIVVVVLLFGGAAIPKLARNLGSAKNEFEKGWETARRPPRTRISRRATARPRQRQLPPPLRLLPPPRPRTTRRRGADRAGLTAPDSGPASSPDVRVGGTRLR